MDETLKKSLLVTFVVSLTISVCALLTVTSCQQDTDRVISKEAKVYVDRYYEGALHRGVVLPDGLVVQMKDMNGVSAIDQNDKQYYLYLDPEAFDGMSKTKKEATVFYWLSVNFTKKRVVSDYSYLNEQIMQDYDTLDREALMDDLFIKSWR